MLIKVIGALTVFSICTGFGFYFAGNEKKFTNELRQLLNCVSTAQSDLRFNGWDIIRISGNCARECSGTLKEVFEDFQGKLCSQMLPDASSCMRASLAQIRTNGELSKLLQLFGDCLGKYDLEGQINALEPVKEACANAYSNACASQLDRTKNRKILGICAGAALIVIFV